MAQIGIGAGRWIFSGALPALIGLIVAGAAIVVLQFPGDRVSLGRLAGFVVLSGVTAMVLIETVKRLLPVRAAYHRRQVAQWLAERAGTSWMAAVAMGQLVTAMDLAEPDRELPNPVGDSDRDPSQRRERGLVAAVELGARWRRALISGPGVGGAFGLPAEQLTAQLGAATERATQDPERYEGLVRALCPDLSERRFALLWDRPGSSPERAELVSEVGDQISSAIDQLQIRLAGRWRHYLRVTAWWLAGVVALLLALLAPGLGVDSAVYVLAALALGGFFAWLARDVTAAVEGLRR